MNISTGILVRFAVLCTLLSMCGCTTFSKSKTAGSQSISADGDSDSDVQTTNDLVVMQPSATSPLISKNDKSHWIALKTKGKSQLSRMRGQLATGDWQGAIASAKSHLMTNPDHIESIMGLANAHALGKQYEMAGYYASQVLKLQPSNSDAMNIVGLRIMMATGNRRADFQDAIQWFQKSIDANGTQVAAGFNLGHLQLELGLSESAAETFALATRRCGECDTGLMGLGISAARSRKSEQATAAFEKLLQKKPFHAEAKYQLAMNYRNNLNDNKRAATLLQEIVSDAEGKYRNQLTIKRQANIALRRIRATDRTGADMRYDTRTSRPHSRKADESSPDAIAAPDEKNFSNPGNNTEDE
jgi:tetratricopeptide (TPR) repeat protein